MLASKRNRDLFGGALRCAGLAAAATVTSAAMADMVPSNGSAEIFGWDQNYVEVFDSIMGGAFAPTQSYVGNGLSITAYAGPTLVGISTNVSDPGSWSLTWASVTQYFTVDNTKEMLLEWDLAGWDGYVNSTVLVYEFGAGFMAYETAASAPGSLLLTLNPGTTYAFQATMVGVHGDGGDGYGFARLSNVPAPGALAILGVGMLGVRRRRRH